MKTLFALLLVIPFLSRAQQNISESDNSTKPEKIAGSLIDGSFHLIGIYEDGEYLLHAKLELPEKVWINENDALIISMKSGAEINGHSISAELSTLDKSRHFLVASYKFSKADLELLLNGEIETINFALGSRLKTYGLNKKNSHKFKSVVQNLLSKG